jgi:hypothetical protein
LTGERPGHFKGVVMRIRDLQWEGIPAWPPHWWFSDERAGEEGVLKDVQFRYDQMPVCVSVVAVHLNESRHGLIILEDPAHLEIVCQKLKENLGRPLSEIGDLEIDISPSIPKMGPKQVRPQNKQDSRYEASIPLKSESK